MQRGTTPTHTFTFDESISGAKFDKVFITYKQGEKVIVEKSAEDIEVTENSFVVKLTQAETLLFSPGLVRIQVRVKTVDDMALASNIVTVPASEILKDGEI